MNTTTTDLECAYLPSTTADGCRKPRGCRECLEKKGCQVGIYGRCESDANAQNVLDYRITSSAAFNTSTPMDPPFWQFGADAATYCPSDDATCQKCIDNMFDVPADVPGGSYFCIGIGDCVCVYNCEFTVPDTPVCAGDLTVEPQTIPPPGPSQDECAFSSLDSKTPRTCKECLDKPGCWIGTGGLCEKDAQNELYFAGDISYKRAIESNVTLPTTAATNASEMAEVQTWVFPASSGVKYCGSDDAICAPVVEDRFGLNATAALDSRFCIGTSGCVVVANCKNPSIVNPGNNSTGNGSPGNNTGNGSKTNATDSTEATIQKQETSSGMTSTATVLIVVGVVVACVAAAWITRVFATRRSRRRQEMAVPVETPKVVE